MENPRFGALTYLKGNRIASFLLYGYFGQGEDIGPVEESENPLIMDFIGSGHQI